MSLARFLGARGSRKGFILCVGKQADEKIYVVIDGCGLSDSGSRRVPGRSNADTGSDGTGSECVRDDSDGN